VVPPKGGQDVLHPCLLDKLSGFGFTPKHLVECRCRWVLTTCEFYIVVLSMKLTYFSQGIFNAISCLLVDPVKVDQELEPVRIDEVVPSPLANGLHMSSSRPVTVIDFKTEGEILQMECPWNRDASPVSWGGWALLVQ
jgi:hypothetical protein